MNYWQECIECAAEECELTLTDAQLKYLVEAIEGGVDNHSMSYYVPSSSDRIADIEREHAKKLEQMQVDYATYQDKAEIAIKKALRVSQSESISIGLDGEVLVHRGRTESIQ